MQLLTQHDLKLINELSSRKFSGNTISSKANEDEINQFKSIKSKLKTLANNFKEEYNETYGILEDSVSSGNPIAIGGTRLNKLWSGIFKGASNKQYSAQVSFVMNPNIDCLDLGFYFGRASAHSLNREKRTKLENRLKLLGNSLSNEIGTSESFKNKYDSLFDYGFQAYSKGKKVTSNEWLDIIDKDPKDSQIIYRICSNESGYIDTTTIKLYVSMIFFMMGLIPSIGVTEVSRNTKSLTPEQRARQAERRVLIGLKGELYVMGKEIEKLNEIFGNNVKEPKHLALDSDNYGFDILSFNKLGEELMIEVKTTTRSKEDLLSKYFYMSANEYKKYEDNKDSYKVYRVFDIESDSPELTEVDMTSIIIESDSYKIRIKTA